MSIYSLSRKLVFTLYNLIIVPSLEDILLPLSRLEMETGGKYVQILGRELLVGNDSWTWANMLVTWSDIVSHQSLVYLREGTCSSITSSGVGPRSHTGVHMPFHTSLRSLVIQTHWHKSL